MYDGTPHEHIDTRRGVAVWVGLTALVTLAGEKRGLVSVSNVSDQLCSVISVDRSRGRAIL